MKIRPFVLLMLLAPTAQAAFGSGPYQITGTATSRDGDLVRTDAQGGRELEHCRIDWNR